MVEGGFEELVLEDQSLVVAESGVHRGQRLGEAVLTVAHVVLAGVVGAVGEPDLEVGRSGLVHHVDALDVMVDRPVDGSLRRRGRGFQA